MTLGTISWTCDTCGEPILSVEDGWVEWLSARNPDGSNKIRGLRLVHHRPTINRDGSPRCRYIERNEYLVDQSAVNDFPLNRYLGPDGLMRLLSFIASREHPIDDALEMIKRLHVPGYEQARHHLGEATVIANGYYTQAEIQAVLCSMDDA